jgi:cytoskeletal protein CcmA (bactofilin family)
MSTLDPSENTDLSSLEETSTVVEGEQNEATLSEDGAATLSQAPGSSTGTPGTPPPAKGPNPLKRLLQGVNIYLLLFLLVLVIAIGILIVALITSKHDTNQQIKTQSLSDTTLKQLAASDATVGDPKQILNVQSNAVFAGKVLVRDSLEVAGTIHVGGSLALPGISVSGTSTFGQVQVNNTLAVNGNTSIQGQLTAQKGLSVNGGTTINGLLSATQITANSLQLNGDLVLTHHITPGGSTPGRSNGSALGSGGTSSVSGSDTAGTVNINTGGSAGAGCFATINFTQRFNSTPRINITPVGSGAAGIAYYVNRSTTNFSICTASTPPSNSSFAFDYFIVD